MKKYNNVTLSFDISKFIWANNQPLDGLPIIVQYPNREKLVGWTTGGRFERDGFNTTVIFSTIIYESADLFSFRLLNEIETGQIKKAFQTELIGCGIDEETGFPFAKESKVVAIILSPKDLQTDGGGA